MRAASNNKKRARLRMSGVAPEEQIHDLVSIFLLILQLLFLFLLVFTVSTLFMFPTDRKATGIAKTKEIYEWQLFTQAGTTRNEQG